ncbi:hypothetical protein [Methylopila sp. M107]|uniref:hypothetical protein n=1 Tax=Methylopila sp. M107 TaxID=1101190 RepID=UPI00035D6A79|nr:hypothetical protein [Methylopila sp. M107]
MRRSITLLSTLALTFAASSAIAQQLKQSTKYTLIVVAGGINDGSRRDGVAMGGTGIYIGREECEAAGVGIKYGVVSGGSQGQTTPSITWICVPLGKP